MNTPHPPFGAPRKELTYRLQKGVVVVLFILLLAFAGLYVLIKKGLEQQNTQQQKLDELVGLVHSAEEHWLEWLLVQDGGIYDEDIAFTSPSQLHQMLFSEYRLIGPGLSRFESLADVSVADSMVLLETLAQNELNVAGLSNAERKDMYAAFVQLKVLDNRLMQINVGLAYDRHIFVERMFWAPVAAFVVVALLILVLSVKFSRQLTGGLAGLHAVVEHRKRGYVATLPVRDVVDELTDLGHLIDNELASRDFDLKRQEESLSLVDKALSQVGEAFLVTNNEGDIIYLSGGAERLWFRDTAVFESMFGIDSGLEDPIGERVADSILLSDQTVALRLSDGYYALNVDALPVESDAESEGVPRFISVRLKSDMAELGVLQHSLTLMEQDVWNAPVRVFRPESPYFGFAKSLEVVRRRVSALLEALNASSDQTKAMEKITKLQQIASLIDEKTVQNGQCSSDVVALENRSIEGLQVELNDMAWLSEQIRDSLILGYELVLQRLALVEKDLSSDVFLLGDVDRCLNEVRAGVLSSLAATEGESEYIRRRFAVDLEHDISKVQSQVEVMTSMAASTLSLLESDRSVGLARLDRARESINEMIERIHGLMTDASTVDSDSVAAVDASKTSRKESNNELGE
ncbi:hypothetical protein HGG82_02730 [Marinomonas sp. M1K-6]|uniref:Uncharacterized protein n=1 Tax=Marinomonas profundi TaxID=2726122 RepID=A0A847QV17_9GAMM|nr:hypothetical protein [Marinomonas profundi]NLQ16538.1 hypothetical protein [Marinomonas profundi]UDV03873.1 hypothetical protein J8N69_03625 [Marinomonas profundi]